MAGDSKQQSSYQPFVEIKAEELILKEKLGPGNFGEVFRAIWHGVEVAVKKFHDQSPQSVAKVRSDAAKWSQVSQHPNVVQLIGFCSSMGALITEYAPNGNAEDLLVKQRKLMGGDDVSAILQIATDAAAGLLHLHKQVEPVIHRDIAARNVFLDRSYRAKLGFSLTTKILPKNRKKIGKVYIKFKEALLPMKWMAPEVFDTGITSKASDVYMFGIMLWELFVHDEPYGNVDGRTAMEQVRNGVRPTKPPVDQCPGAVWVVMCRCWCQNPNERPSIEEVLHELTHIKQIEDERSKVDHKAVKNATAECEETVEKAVAEGGAETQRLNTELKRKKKGEEELKAKRKKNTVPPRNKDSYATIPDKGIIGGKQGSAQGQFNLPWGACFDSKHQQIIISETDNHRVQLFSAEGKFVSTFGSGGRNNGQFSVPRGVCIQAVTNNIIVAEQYNHRVQVFDNDNDDDHPHLYTIGGRSKASKDLGKFNKPGGVCSNKRAHIIVADTGNHRVQIFDEKGRFLRAMGSPNCLGRSDKNLFNHPHDIYVDEEHGDRILVADQNNKRISIWNGDGSAFIKAIPVGDAPWSVCVDRYHRILVGTRNDIRVYDSANDKLLQTIGSAGSQPGQFCGVCGLCVNDDNTLIAADYFNHRIQMF